MNIIYKWNPLDKFAKRFLFFKINIDTLSTKKNRGHY